MDVRRFKGPDFIALVALIATAVLALLQSWQRWLDPIIDTGRDLYLAGAILDGAKLYRDVRYQYPPLAPFALAGWSALFGRSLDAFTTFGILTTIAVAAFLIMLLRRTAGTAAAFTAALLFLALCFCGASTFGCNFLFPYSYAATLGIALYLGYAAFLHRQLFVQPAGAANLYVAGALGIAAASCKIELAFAVVLTFLIMASVHRLRLRLWLPVVALAIVTVVAAFLVFRDPRAGHDWLRDQLFSSSLLHGASAQRFYAHVSGSDETARNLLRAFAGCIFLGAICAALGAIDRLLRKRPDARVGMAVAASLLMAAIGWVLPPTDPLFRAWTLLLPLAVVFTLLRQRRGELFFFALIALVAIVRIPLNVTPEWYGFTLAVPAFATMAFVLFEELPRRGVYSRAVALFWIPLFVVVAAKGLRLERTRFAVKTSPIVTARGTLYDHNAARAAVLNELTAMVRSLGAKELVVMPEGVTLNYLTGIHTPLFHLIFTPPETGAPADETLVLGELTATRPRFIAVVTRDVSEYGSAGFGADYDRDVLEYLRTHYTVRRVWPDRGFQAVLLEVK